MAFGTTKNMSCFVPQCANKIGVSFPKEQGLRERWLTSLKLQHLEPQSSSFVCLEHVKENDLIQEDYAELQETHTIRNEEYKDKQKICRVCMSEKNLVRKLSDPLEGETLIISGLMLCCYPLKISLTDKLPKDICETCLNDLETAHRLRERCLSSVKKIQVRLERQHLKKRKLAEDERWETAMKIEKKANEEESIENIKREVKTDDLMEFINIKQRNDVVRTQEGCNVTNVELKELLNTLSTDEIPSTSEAASNHKVRSLIGHKIVLPMKALAKFASPTGKFPCKIIEGIQNTSFVEAGFYLYYYGLLKYNVRNLRCVVPNCKAHAEFRLLENNRYEDNVLVKESHNHPPSRNDDRKKQMFFHVMRRRVQLDKTLNIKSLYEEFCKLEPDLRELVPLRNVINEICRNQATTIKKNIDSFEEFYNDIESQQYSKLHFSLSGHQFYQDKFTTENESSAVIFSNREVLNRLSHSKVMYVDASFKIDTNEDFKYQLVTVLLWIEDSYYPVLFAFINKKCREIFKKIFEYLHDILAPNLRPDEIVTDYEANLYYALGETYLDSHIGGSVFYYTQNLYKKVCLLNLSRDLETNSYFRSVYHMLLMLPLLPVNTIPDGLHNIEVQAKDLGLTELAKPLFDHVRTQWMESVTPNLFCVHRLENRINENVIAPFKKLRDFLLVSKGKVCKYQTTVVQVVEKLIDLDAFLSDLYARQDKKSFGRDLSSFQKKNVLRAWLYIETHPKININNFFTKVLGYIKCMENQLWIWGFYRYIGTGDDLLINASNFSIINCMVSSEEEMVEEEELVISPTVEETYEQFAESVTVETQDLIQDDGSLTNGPMLIMEAVLDQNGKVLIQTSDDNLDKYLNNSKVFV